MAYNDEEVMLKSVIISIILIIIYTMYYNQFALLNSIIFGVIFSPLIYMFLAPYYNSKAKKEYEKKYNDGEYIDYNE